MEEIQLPTLETRVEKLEARDQVASTILANAVTRLAILEAKIEEILIERVTANEKGKALVDAAKSGNPVEILKILGQL